jgi:hypothetical protein
MRFFGIIAWNISFYHKRKKKTLKNFSHRNSRNNILLSIDRNERKRPFISLSFPGSSQRRKMLSFSTEEKRGKGKFERNNSMKKPSSPHQADYSRIWFSGTSKSQLNSPA